MNIGRIRLSLMQMGLLYLLFLGIVVSTAAYMLPLQSELQKPEQRETAERAAWLTQEMKKGTITISEAGPLPQNTRGGVFNSGLEKGLRFGPDQEVAGTVIFLSSDIGFNHPKVLCKYEYAPEGGIVVEGMITTDHNIIRGDFYKPCENQP